MEDHQTGWNHAVNRQPNQPLMRPLTDDQLRPRNEWAGYTPNEPSPSYPTPQTGRPAARPTQPAVQPPTTPTQPAAQQRSSAVQPPTTPTQPARATPSRSMIAPAAPAYAPAQPRSRAVPTPMPAQSPTVAARPVPGQMPEQPMTRPTATAQMPVQPRAAYVPVPVATTEPSAVSAPVPAAAIESSAVSAPAAVPSGDSSATDGGARRTRRVTRHAVPAAQEALGAPATAETVVPPVSAAAVPPVPAIARDHAASFAPERTAPVSPAAPMPIAAAVPAIARDHAASFAPERAAPVSPAAPMPIAAAVPAIARDHAASFAPERAAPVSPAAPMPIAAAVPQTRAATVYPAYQAPALAPDMDDDLPLLTEQERQPMPVPTADFSAGKATSRKRDAIVIVACIVGVLAVLAALYFFGVLDPLAVKLGLPPRNPAAVVSTADMTSSFKPVEGSDVNPMTIVEASTALKPTLQSVSVAPAEAPAPASLVFTVVTNQGASAVRLMRSDATTLNASGSSLLSGDSVTWTLTAEVDAAYSGEIRVFLRNDDGVWLEGDKTCHINVSGE